MCAPSLDVKDDGERVLTIRNGGIELPVIPFSSPNQSGAAGIFGVFLLILRPPFPRAQFHDIRR